MEIRNKLHYQLNNFPMLKKSLKSIYQHIFYTISDKTVYEGKLIKVTPENSDFEYFFGYYDKSPWDATGRYMLCHRVIDTRKKVSPDLDADIIIIDTIKDLNDPERYRIIGNSKSWNVQQGCMLQWLGPDYHSKVIYNDCRNGKYVSVICDVHSGENRVLQGPVYSVSADGTVALFLDFSRLYNLRPGYGYYNLPEKTLGIGLPRSTAIWKLDLVSGKIESVLDYTDFSNFFPRKEMLKKNSIHKVNHIMISPNGKRFMVLHRWFDGRHKYSRLITCDIDGRNMYILSDYNMVSHCCWKDDEHILAYVNHHDGIGYYLFTDMTDETVRINCLPDRDGHPSYSPNGEYVLTDTYADRKRMCSLQLTKNGKTKIIAKVFEPFEYDNDTRCDLHPRWKRDGTEICIDAAFEGRRGMYVIDVDSCL